MEKLSEFNMKEITENINMDYNKYNETNSLLSLDNFNIDTLKLLYEQLNSISGLKDEDKENILDVIIKILDNLLKMNFFNEEVTNSITFEEKERFFINPFSVKLLKEIMNSSTDFNSAYVREKQLKIYQIYLDSFIKNIQNMRFLAIWEVIADSLSDNKPIHKARSKMYDICNGERFLELNYDLFNPNPSEWRENLKIGDIIDYLYFPDQHAKEHKIGLWTRAEIKELDPNKNARIVMIGSGDFSHVSLMSSLVLPFNTLSNDYEWRENLKASDQIDILDGRKTWILGIVTEKFEKTRIGSIKYKWVKIGNRVYDSNGRHKDRKNNRFFGWGEAHDKEVSAHDPIIRMPGKYSKEVAHWEVLNNYHHDSKYFNEVETYFPFEINQKKFYAIGKRHKFDREIDIEYINIINYFGDNGGFDKLLEVLSSSNYVYSFDVMNNIFNLSIEIVNNIFAYLHIDFAKKFITKFIESSLAFLTDFVMNTDNRNFKREKFEANLKKLKEIMSKIYIESDVNLKYEYFTINFGLSSLKSPILDKKLIGLKMLTDTLEICERYSHSAMPSDSHIPMTELYKLLKNENIFDLLFGLNSHSQIIQKGGELIRYFIKGKLFGEEELTKLLSIANDNNDFSLKASIYKLLSNNVYNMDKVLQKILAQIILSNKEHIIELEKHTPEFELLLSVQKRLPTYECQDIHKEIGFYFYHLIFESVTNNYNAKENVISEFISLLKTHDMREFRALFIESICQRIKAGKDIIRSMKVLRRLMNSLQSSVEESQRQKFLNIINNQNLIDVIIEYLQVYSLELHEKIRNNPNNLFPDEQMKHRDLITELFSFLNYLQTSQKILHINYEQILSLYHIFVENRVVFLSGGNNSNEINQFFKFLKDAEEKKTLPINTFQKIFTEMINSNNIEFDNIISLELMKILWYIFLSINKSLSNIYITENKSSAASPNLGILNTDNIKSIKTYKKPFDLEGFELIFKAIVSSPQGEVAKVGISNLLQLFECNEKQSNERGEIWLELIKKIIIFIKENSNNHGRILNAISILKGLIEESEKKGTACVTSHSSILKHSVINLKITNGITITHDNKTIFSIKIFSNTTLWDLKILLAKRLNIIPDIIRVSDKSNKDFTDYDHGKTMGELKIKNYHELKISKNPIIDQIPKISLVENKRLTDKFKKILSEIFYAFAGNKKAFGDKNNNMDNENIDNVDASHSEICMSKEDCARYLKIATESNYALSSDDPRIIQLFKTYDDDKDELITCENFYNFYYDAIEKHNKISIVWENLKSFNIRNDLRQLNEPLDIYNQGKEIMPRWVIAKTPEFFNVIFELQDSIKDENITKELSKFLNTICTNPEIFRNILSLDRLKQKEDWNLYIENNNYYKQLYCLQIIESFFEEFELGDMQVDSIPAELSILGPEDMELINPDHKIFWIETFLTKGGLDHIMKIFINYENNLNFLKKKCLTLTIKILHSSFSVLFRAIKDKPIDVHSFMRKESINSVEDIKDDINISRKQSLELYENFLIQKLSEKYGKELLKTYDFIIIFKKVIDILFSIVNKYNNDSEERTIAASASKLFSLLFIFSDNISALSDYIFSKEINFHSLIVQGLLLNSNDEIRETFYNTLKILTEKLIELNEYKFILQLVNLIQGKIISLEGAEKSNCKYLFLLEEYLISISYYNDNINKSISLNFLDLAFYIVDILYDSKVTEEALLSGYLKLLSLFVKYDKSLKNVLVSEKNLIKLLINKFTFKDVSVNHNTNSLNFTPVDLEELKDTNKLLEYNNSEEIRDNIFDLIINLVEDNYKGLSLLFNTKIVEFPELISKGDKKITHYNPNTDKRSPTGFLGIKNLGCICYMNSMLQQFFTIPSFRYAIMQINDGKGFTLNEENKDVDDNVLHQLQKMFSFLELSNRVCYNPKEFCFAFKDFNGKPTNLSQQQDTQEFLGRMLDFLENSIKHTEYKYILQSVFGGKTCSQLICKECGNTRNNFEDFYNLSLEVKGMKDINASLDKFISEEKIEGYKCDKCEKTTTVSKVNSLAELPNVLIVHLQRILFNYDTGMNEKVNSRFEFPKNLKLKSHSTEEIESKRNSNQDKKDDGKSNDLNPNSNSNLNPNDEGKDRVYERDASYYDYELVGVIIHTGHADGGHYYSYINTNREGSDSNWNHDSNNVNWLTFNDDHVSHFDLNTLQENCFGGSESENVDINSFPEANRRHPGATTAAMNQQTSTSDWETSNAGQHSFETGKSAYMLIYERKIKSPIKILVPKEKVETIINRENKQLVTINKTTEYSILKEYDIFSKDENDNEMFNTTKTKIFNTIFNNEESQEFIRFIPFYGMRKTLPVIYYNEVTNDNIQFYNDQKIYNEKFNIFLEKVVNAIDNLLSKGEDKSIDIKEMNRMFEVILSYVFEVISKSYCKQNISGIVVKVNQLLITYPSISNSILNYLNNKKELLYDILFSSEEVANNGYKNLLLFSLKNNLIFYKDDCRNYIDKIKQQSESGMIVDKEYADENENVPPSIVLLENLIDLMPIQATRYWIKILSYLEIFEELIKMNDKTIIDLFKKRELLSKMLDFFLQKDSPYYKKEDNRVEMGKMSSPKFAPLINTISILVCLSGTLTWNEVIYSQTGKRPLTYNNNLTTDNTMMVDDNINKTIEKPYSLTEKETELLYNPIFTKLALKESYNNTAMSKLISHLMYNNYEFTKVGMYLIIELFNKGISLQDAKNAFDLIPDVIAIDDDYKIQRYEWLFGIPQLSINISSFSNNPSIDTYFNLTSLSKLFTYHSPLLNYTPNDSLVDRLFNNYQKNSDFIQISNIFNDIIIQNQNAFNYFASLPHPKPGDKHPLNAKAKNYLLEIIQSDVSKFNNNKKYNNAIKGFENHITNYEYFTDAYSNTYKDIFSMNYQIGNVYSDVIYKWIEYPQYEMLENNKVAIICVEYETEINLKENKNFGFNNNAYVCPDDGAQELNSGMFNSTSEDNFFRNNFNKLYPLIKYRRKHKLLMPAGTIVKNSARRFIAFNCSGEDYKLRIRFRGGDDCNTYVPHTEYVIISKKFSGQNICNFVKNDYTKDYGSIYIEVEMNVIDSNKENGGNGIDCVYFEKKQVVKQEESDFNIDEINAAVQGHGDAAFKDDGSIPIECTKCSEMNFVKDFGALVLCTRCNRDIF